MCIRDRDRWLGQPTDADRVAHGDDPRVHARVQGAIASVRDLAVAICGPSAARQSCGHGHGVPADAVRVSVRRAGTDRSGHVSDPVLALRNSMLFGLFAWLVAPG